MKKLVVLFLLVSSFVFAADVAKSAKKEVQHKTGSLANGADGKSMAPQQEVKNAPCATTQDEIMKKLDDKKKADMALASSGKKLTGLQGLGSDTGCKVK